MWNELGIPNHLASVAMPPETIVGALPLVLVEKKTPSNPPHPAKLLQETVLPLVENCFRIISEVLSSFGILQLIYPGTSDMEQYPPWHISVLEVGVQ